MRARACSTLVSSIASALAAPRQRITTNVAIASQMRGMRMKSM